MKKTLSILALMGGFAALSQAATVFTTTNSTTNTVSNAWFNGFRANLDPTLANTRLTTTADDETVFTKDMTVSLDSVTVNIRSAQSQTVRLALTNSAGLVLGLSTNGVTSAGNATWNFENTQVSASADLFFVYVNNTPALGATLTAADMVMCGGGTLANYGNTNGTSSLTHIGTNSAQNMTLQSQNWTVGNLSIVTSALATPEPATASLSLLGLAALMMRRRRA